MKFKFLFVIVSALLSGLYLQAAESISTTTPDGRTVEVSFITPDVVKVANYAPGETELTANGLDRAATEVNVISGTISSSVEPDRVKFISNKTKTTRALLDTATGELTLYGGGNRIIVDKGLRPLKDGKKEIELQIPGKGAFYGAGERGHKLNLRGDTLVMYNRPTYGYTGTDPRINQMNITMPVVLSSDGYALVFDDYAASELILSDPIKYITEAPGAVSYYFVNGANTLADVVENLTAVTGRQDLPPLWALGYITSKYGYKTQQDTEDVIKHLKADGYPVDAVVLDLFWYGKEQDMGRLDWEPEQWPNPEKMLKNLDKKDVKLIPISQPYVLKNGKGIDNYNALAPQGFFVKDSLGNPLEVEIWVGKGGMFDVSNPDTRAWLANRYSELTDMGVASWWGDLGEPEQHPYASRHANGLKGREYHNRYGNDWSRIIYDLFHEKYPDTRLLSLMRGGTTGLQQYSVFPWSGDVSRSWGGLEPQIRIMLNSGLSGLGYMHHDVGGFAVDETNPIDPELYVRWLQLGVFSPVLRTHSQQYAEPFNYPEHQFVIKDLIDKRYRWLPYNYTLAYENATKGWPLVRPLNFHDEGPAGCDTITDEYLWGRDVLVAPVLKQGATSRKITFPLGRWVDYADPRVSYTGTINSYEVPLDKLPIFVRAGAFIPQAADKMENTGDYNPSKLVMEYFPFEGTESSYTLFDDNRLSPKSLEENQYRLITFKGTCFDNETIDITVSSTGTYAGAPKKIDVEFQVKGIAKTPTSVTVNGKKIKSKYDAVSATISFNIKFIPGKTTTINIR